MSDMEVKTELLESLSLKQKTNLTEKQLHLETDSTDDLSCVKITEQIAGRSSSPDSSISVEHISTKRENPRDVTEISPSLKDEISSRTSAELSPSSSISDKESELSSHSSKTQSKGTDNIVNPDVTASLNLASGLDNGPQIAPHESCQNSTSTAAEMNALYPLKKPPINELIDTPQSLPANQVLHVDESPPIPSKRRLTSPFAWLSRNNPKESNTAKIPTTKSRSGTISSATTDMSNTEVANAISEQANLSEGMKGVKRPVKNTLKDRFKHLRTREEAGISNSLQESDKCDGVVLTSQKTSTDANHASLDSTAQKTVPISPHTTTSNSVSSEAPIDWDLWQSVIDEGPAAVARTSPEELNHAITSGIPNVIRGVVWQILAQSKNEELEMVYKELIARGTEKDPDRMSISSGFGSFALSSINGKDEVITSSSSSVHSDYSTAAMSTLNAIRSPSVSKDTEALAKSQVMSLTDKKKKAMEDAASLKKLEKTIRRDLGARTSFSKFASSAGLQEGLFGVCKAYALFDEGVGYAQGLNFIAMPLLFNMPEEEAFCLLVKLMNRYQLRDLFTQDMPGLHIRLYQFERILEDLEPALYCHLQRRQVSPHLYATQWFLTLFAYRFPLQLVLRIFDLILSEGLEAIIKFGIVLMQKNAPILLNITDLTTLTNFLKDRLFDVYIDASPSHGSILESSFFGSSSNTIDKEVYHADQLVQDACAVKVTKESLNSYALEWEEKNRLEKEREAEIQNLRFNNKKLSHKIRKMEQRAQDHDTEHTALATELVLMKLKNEEISDENESLKIQVQELRSMIEKLPLEVEQNLRKEMDRLIDRNREVHEENTKLEEEMSQMEKSLVDTKLQYAEIHAAHETISRKWNDLRKALAN